MSNPPHGCWRCRCRDRDTPSRSCDGSAGLVGVSLVRYWLGGWRRDSGLTVHVIASAPLLDVDTTLRARLRA